MVTYMSEVHLLILTKASPTTKQVWEGANNMSFRHLLSTYFSVMFSEVPVQTGSDPDLSTCHTRSAFIQAPARPTHHTQTSHNSRKYTKGHAVTTNTRRSVEALFVARVCVVTCRIK